MKQRIGTAFILAILLLASGQLFAEETTAGIVNALGGDIIITRETREIEVAPGDVVYDADVIATGPGSFIEIALENEKGTVRVDEDSKIEISNFSTDEEAGFSLALFFGTVLNSLTKGENETFTVTTSSLSLGVRGTEFEVTQSLFGEALVTVIDGEVAVGESNSEGVIDENYEERINEIVLSRGQAAEKVQSGQVVRREMIERELWRQGRMQKRKQMEKYFLLGMQKKAIILGRQMKKIDKAITSLARVRKRVNAIFIEIDEKIMNNPRIPRSRKKQIRTKLLQKNAEAIAAMQKGSRKILRATRVILDEYKATRELLVELLARVDDGRITFHNPELKQELRANLIAVKKVDKEAIELERSWRKLARSIRMDKRRLKEFGY
jgi:hypothetical protein